MTDTLQGITQSTYYPWKKYEATIKIGHKLVGLDSFGDLVFYSDTPQKEPPAMANPHIPVANAQLFKQISGYVDQIKVNGFRWQEDGPTLLKMFDVIVASCPDMAGQSDIKFFLTKFTQMLSIAYGLNINFQMIEAFAQLYTTNKYVEA